MFLDSTKEGVWETEVPVRFRGEAQVGGLETNPVGGMGNEVRQKLTTFFCGLNYIFTQNTSIISYYNKVGLLHFPILNATLCCLVSTFWLDSTLKLYCAPNLRISPLLVSVGK